MSKLIIRFDDMTELEALDYAKTVVEAGRISQGRMGDQFCYHTTFGNDVHVSAFKPSNQTDTLVIYKETQP